MEVLVPVKEALQYRHKQIDALGRLIGEPGYPLPACIYAQGDSGSGKSTVLEAVLSSLCVRTWAASCVELYSQQLLFQTAINYFADHVPCARNDYSAYSSCESLCEFVRLLQVLGRRPGHEEDRLALVLYQCERLRDCEPVSLPALCRLQELCGGAVNICVVLVSTLPIDKLLPSGGVAMPFVVHFPQYSKEELVELLLKERCPEEESDGFSEDFHRTYVTLVLSVFYPASRSLSEMRHLLLVHWKAYIGPVEQGEVSVKALRSDDVRRLWRNIEPHLRRALTTLYVKEVNSTQYCEMQQLQEQSNNKLPSVSTISEGAAKVELPYYSKFLLIAAYLASYNPAKSDRRFFVKHHGKQKKTQAMVKAKERSCSQLTGPKQFPLDRLLAIFYAISEHKQTRSAALMTQLSTLVSLRLVVQVGADDAIDAPKYKCAVSLQFIRTVARTVDFDVVHHLYDFS